MPWYIILQYHFELIFWQETGCWTDVHAEGRALAGVHDPVWAQLCRFRNFIRQFSVDWILRQMMINLDFPLNPYSLPEVWLVSREFERKKFRVILSRQKAELLVIQTQYLYLLVSAGAMGKCFLPGSLFWGSIQTLGYHVPFLDRSHGRPGKPWTVQSASRFPSLPGLMSRSFWRFLALISSVTRTGTPTLHNSKDNYRFHFISEETEAEATDPTLHNSNESGLVPRPSAPELLTP